MRRLTLTLALVVLLSGSLTAQTPTPPPTNGGWKHWTLELAAGGGFAGIPEIEVQSEPSFDCGSSVCTPTPGAQVLVKNLTYTWRPSLSTGLVFFRRLTAEPDAMGFGIGGHFVFVPKGDAAVAAPALTVHVGKTGTQLFFGAIFLPGDDADLPGGGNRSIVPIGVNPQSFIRRNASGRTPTFYGGIVVGGIAMLGAK